MKFTLASLLCAASLTLATGCRKSAEDHGLPMDTIKPAELGSHADTTADTTHAKADSATTKSNLPPMAKAIEPDRLAQYLPKPAGWSQSGDIQKEIQARDNFNKSDVSETYTQGSKKLVVEIDDNAYVPYLYDPYTPFKGSYLDDDNTQRTETTTLNGYREVQTWEKHAPHGSVVVFPGNRYVVKVTMDGAADINEVRSIAQSMDLKALESLQ